MSIALSAVIKPSRLLLALVATECMLTAASGLLIGFGGVGNLLLPIRISLATLCMMAALYGMWRYYRERRTIQIDISADGQIRMADIRADDAAQALNPGLLQVRLLECSTICSQILLLRLRLASGSVRTIAILPDCVSKNTFRVLSVACRWIAAHRSDGMHKAGVPA